MAPLFFVGLALAAIGSVRASPAIWLAAVLMLLSSAWFGGPRKIPRSAIGVTIAGFVLWIVLGNVLWNEGYTSAATYHAALLASGYMLGARVHDEALPFLSAAGFLLAAFVVIWALVQILIFGYPRATAGFETPGTLSIFLVMGLIPACAATLVSGSHWRLGAVCLLAAGVAAASSRAGYISLGAGLLTVLVACRHAGLNALPAKRLAAIFSIIATTWGVVALWQQLPPIWPSTRAAMLVAQIPELGSVLQPSGVAKAAIAASASGISRLELYALALQAVPDHPLLGSGYLSFENLLEANRDRVPTYSKASTSFVHNDYLQILLEVGLVGSALLLAAVAVPIVTARRFLISALPPHATRLPWVSALGVIAALAVHALFDYPFYVPICLVGFGVAAGVLDRAGPNVYSSGATRLSGRATALSWRTLGRVSAIVAFAMFLVAPVLAEAAAAWANRNWRTAHPLAAATWFEVARRVEPRDWRYHWYAGQFWFSQALQGHKPEAARRADAAFADAQAAHPGEVRALLARIVGQREMASLLATPVDTVTLRRWTAQAVKMAPLSIDVRLEELRVLRFVGATAQARSAAARLLNDFPELTEAQLNWARVLHEERP